LSLSARKNDNHTLPGILPSPSNKKFFLIKQEYPYYNELMKLFTYVSISMKFSKAYKKIFKVINCEVVKEYLKDKANFKDAQLIHNSATGAYYFIFENLPDM
jgi:hypothetical protein